MVSSPEQKKKASVNDIEVKLDGNIIDPVNEEGAYKLSANLEQEYEVTYTLPKGYIGILPWKLEIMSNTNELQRDSVQGYIHSKAKTDSEKQHIKALQIDTLKKGEGGTQYSTCNFPMNNESFTNNYLKNLDDFVFDKLENEGAPDQNGNLTAKVDGIGISYISAKTYLEYYRKNTGYLDQFDMIIIGFSDCYTTSTTVEEDQLFAEGLIDYIHSGKSVLFTHDTTSIWNVSKEQYSRTGYDQGQVYWGYAFNKYVRTLVGMDRYGASDSETAMNLGQTAQKDTDLYSQIQKDSGNLVENESHQWVESDGGKDIGYLPKSDKKTIVRQLQGFNYGVLNQFMKTGTYRLFSNTSKTNGQNNNTTVAQVNSGQITSYPYTIAKEIKVAKTHYQYYQLDLTEDADLDNESDLVVWYTINGSDNIYKKSQNDVRNNYYIYTKGNVTYSGVGHASGLKDDELKLYVNTIIASYQSGLRASDVSFVESADSAAEEIKTRYLTYDNTLGKNLDYTYQTENPTDSSIEIKSTASFYFVPEDRNLVRNLKSKEMKVSFYVPCTKTQYDAETDEEEKKKVENGSSTIYLLKVDARNLNKYANVSEPIRIYEGDTEKEMEMEKLESGVTYRLELPFDFLLSDFAPRSLYVFANAKITKNTLKNSEVETEEGYSYINITRMGLYDLD